MAYTDCGSGSGGLKLKFVASVTIGRANSREYLENAEIVAAKHKFTWAFSGENVLESRDYFLDPLVHRVELLTNDLKAAKIKVRRVQVVETILDVEEE